MLIAADTKTGEEPVHHFLYTQVLGIYYANVIYTGPQSMDYRLLWMEFLWVRWYTWIQSQNCLRFDHLTFPPMANKNSFGFVDPATVLWGCHIIPVFSSGKVHIDGCGLSRCTKDVNDWSYYYANRWVKKHWDLYYAMNPDIPFQFCWLRHAYVIPLGLSHWSHL